MPNYDANNLDCEYVQCSVCENVIKGGKWFARISGDLYHVMHKLSGHLQLIHANDNSGNYDDHKPPGEGNIDWNKLLTELSQIEFHGGFILELAGNKEPEIVLAEARRARRYLREISRRLALSSPPTVTVANRPA